MKQVNGIWLPDEDTYFEALLQKSQLWEPEKLALALSHVKNLRTAIDVGAHVGLYASTLANNFNNVFAIEANKPTFDCLVKNMSAFDNVTSYNLAIGHKEERLSICRDATRDGNTGSYYVGPQNDFQVSVDMIRLDQLEFEAVDFLKIDVEGFETNVLRGGMVTIDKWSPVILMEEKRFKGRYDLAPAGDILLAIGYKRVASIRNDHIYAR